MRCCEAWEPVGKCFDPVSFKCTDTRGLSQIIASLTLENLAEREAEIGNLFWTQTEKDNAVAKCRQGLRAWRAKRPLLCLHAVTDEDGHPLENEDESGRRLCDFFGVRLSKHAPKVQGITTTKIYLDMFKKLLTTSAGLSTKMNWTSSWPQRRNLLLVLIEFRTAFTDVREVWVRGFRFVHTKHVLEGGSLPELFAKSRTVFIPKSYDVDNNGRIIGSLEALRPLTLCNCDCKILTTAICRGLHWYTMRCIHSSQRCMSSRQTTDNIFEIETIALAHVACAPRESGILVTDFAAACPSVNHSWIFGVLEKNRVASVHQPFPTKDLPRQHHACGICRNDSRTVPYGVRQGCPAGGFSFAMAFDPYL